MCKSKQPRYFAKSPHDDLTIDRSLLQKSCESHCTLLPPCLPEHKYMWPLLPAEKLDNHTRKDIEDLFKIFPSSQETKEFNHRKTKLKSPT